MANKSEKKQIKSLRVGQNFQFKGRIYSVSLKREDSVYAYRVGGSVLHHFENDTEVLWQSKS